MTNAIKITPAFAIELQNSSWVIINQDYAVGAYKSRQAARDAKAEQKLEGKILNKSEVEFEIMMPVLAKVEEVEQVFPLTDLTKFGTNSKGETCCPKCGSIEVFDGEAPQGKVINEDVIHGCHECDWLVDDRKNFVSKTEKPAKVNGPILHKSEIEHPCKTVWGIAEDMKKANPNVKRGEVLAACVAKGIAYYTARTQYQQWLGIQKEMAAREAAQANKG